MAIIGGIFLVIAVILFFVRRYQRAKLLTLQSAEKVTIAGLKQTAAAIAQDIGGGNWRDHVKVSGVISCSQPLQSALKQEACVYYDMSVDREYEAPVITTNSEGEREERQERKSEPISSQKRSTPFYVNDGTDAIEVYPEGANIETIEILDEFHPAQLGATSIAFGSFSTYRPEDRATLGYRYTEKILPLDRRVFIVAMATDGGGNLVLQKPIDQRQKFLISLKDEETLIQETKKVIRGLEIATFVTLGLGVLLIIIGTA